MDTLDKAIRSLTASKKTLMDTKKVDDHLARQSSAFAVGFGAIFEKFRHQIASLVAEALQINLKSTHKSEIVNPITVGNFPRVQKVAITNDMGDAKDKALLTRIDQLLAVVRAPQSVTVRNQADLSTAETLLEAMLSEMTKKGKEEKKDEKEDPKKHKAMMDKLDKLVKAVKDIPGVDFSGFPVALSTSAYKNAAGETKSALVDADNHVQVDIATMPAVTVDTGDISIGAVEIKDSTTDTRATVGANGLEVDVQSSVLPTGASTAANQTTGNNSLSGISTKLSDNTQTTQLVDAGGEAVTVTGGKLDVNATISTVGLATETKQDTGNTSLSSIDGKVPALGQALGASSVPVVLTAAQVTTLTPPAAITGFATAANQLPDGHNVTVDNQPTEFPLPAAQITTLTPPAAITGFATSANQLPDGHNVTVDNASLAVTNGGTFVTQVDGAALTQLQTINSLTPAVYDYIALTYTGDNLTGVVFKVGGAAGSTISTLTLAYTGAVLDSVTKT